MHEERRKLEPEACRNALGVLGKCCLEQLLPSTQQRTDAAPCSADARSVHVI